jgi:hypothetical protein
VATLSIPLCNWNLYHLILACVHNVYVSIRIHRNTHRNSEADSQSEIAIVNAINIRGATFIDTTVPGSKKYVFLGVNCNTVESSAASYCNCVVSIL